MATALKSLVIDVAKSGIQTKLSTMSASPTSTATPPPSFRTTAATTATSHATSLGKAAGKKYIDAYITIPRLIVRSLQFILALVAVGVYGKRLAADRAPDSKTDSLSPEWIFAVAVSTLAAGTALLFALATPLALLSARLETHKAWAWDFLLALFWLIAFGVFARIFLKRTDEQGEYKGASTGLMKTMLWVDLTCAILWIVSGSYGVMRKFAGNKINSASEKVGGKVVGKLFAPKTEVSQV